MAKHRSPNYPAIGLSEAVQRIGRLFEKEKKTVVQPIVAATDLGYKGLNGPSRTVLSALKKYGLLDELKTGGRVSDLAVALLHPANDEQRLGALRDAALRPELFRELQQNYSQGSDAAIAAILIQRGFSPQAATQVIEGFRDTMSIAQLGASGYNPPTGEGEPEAMAATTGLEARATDAISVTDPARGAVRPRLYSWALSKDVSARLEITGDPLTKEQAERLRQYVDLTVSALAAEGE